MLSESEEYVIRLLKLRILSLIDRYKQVTAVANALEMKQPTVSFHMKKMETEWGVKLFEPRAGKIFLTAAGKMLLPYASQINALYAEAETKLTEWRDNERTMLRIGCTDCAMASIAESDWFAAVNGLPNVQVSMTTDEEEMLYSRLQADRLDLVLCGQPPRDASRLQFEKLTASSLRLIVPADHPLTRQIELVPQDLYSYSFYDLTEYSVHELVAIWRDQLALKLKVNARYDSVEMIFRAVHAQGGLAVLPECALPDPAGRVAFLTLPGHSSQWSLYACWRMNFWNPALLRQVIGSIF
ncbi:LysR family transcriptional regulator [Cohnella endophytica]|uniref:LysR family transcriptional regulator n=1 Tax=Cohnella endophytica TaxID=2419778 RepID=A0A494Y0W3_9BACL|nr:LysR family transcriptional regulator [Cohnella endophytica]RKP54983.1 LysR family transcriptional regulator [Cohnella endophytica]